MPLSPGGGGSPTPDRSRFKATTTINLFLGFSDATSGEARVDGVDGRRDPLGTRRMLLSVPEQIGLFGELTGRENRAYFAALSGIQDRSPARYLCFPPVMAAGRCNRSGSPPERHSAVATKTHDRAMITDPQPAETERCTILRFLIDSMTLYAAAQYPTAESVELVSAIRARHAQHAARRDQLPGIKQDRHKDFALWRSSMNDTMQRLLHHPALALFARIALTFPFWGSGVAKLVDFDSGVAEMAHFGLHPAILFNIATIAVQLLGSILIIANRLAWLGAGALAVFTGLTVILVHSFWSMTEEPFRTIAFHTATEHVGIIGGLVAISILGARRPSATRSSREINVTDRRDYR
jgi:transmembrane protein